MKFNELACSKENGEELSMIDVFIHKLIGEDLSELKIPEMQVSASYNLVTEPFFRYRAKKAPLPVELHGFSCFSWQCGVYLVKSFCYGIAQVLAIACGYIEYATKTTKPCIDG